MHLLDKLQPVPATIPQRPPDLSPPSECLWCYNRGLNHRATGRAYNPPTPFALLGSSNPKECLTSYSQGYAAGGSH